MTAVRPRDVVQKGMTPVCTIMVGRTDDWIKDVGKASGELIDPECYEWAGVAVAKKGI